MIVEMKCPINMNPLRYFPITSDLYTILDFVRFKKRLLREKYDLYVYKDGGILLMAKDEWANHILRREG